MSIYNKLSVVSLMTFILFVSLGNVILYGFSPKFLLFFLWFHKRIFRSTVRFRVMK